MLKISCFLIIFALTSSLISIWFDYQRQEIDAQLTNSKYEQELFRNVYELLWDEYFKQQSSKHFLNEYAHSISETEAVEEPKQLICMLDNEKAYYGDIIIINTLNLGSQYLTKFQKEKYKTSLLEEITKTRISAIRDDLHGFCSSEKYTEIGQASAAVTARIESLLVIARELKQILENRILLETNLLTENYKKSNIAIFTAFLIQFFVFAIVSIVDINTSSFRRSMK